MRNKSSKDFCLNMRKKGSKENYSMIWGTKYKNLFEYEKEKTEGKLFWLATKNPSAVTAIWNCKMYSFSESWSQGEDGLGITMLALNINVSSHWNNIGITMLALNIIVSNYGENSVCLNQIIWEAEKYCISYFSDDIQC